ncbi:MAG TPA: glycosyltransferase family 4 protein [Acidimicrobiales bacterium]|nr:glycosyltransferase family 4 protein [Acidimicrobiales bacterium]
MSAVHQFIPSFVSRDAIGAHTLQVRSVLQEMGLRSEVFAENTSPDLEPHSRPYESYRPKPGDWLLYQASTGSKVAEYLLGRPEPQIVNYHNVTPASTFGRWEPRLADEMADGRRQVAKLASVARHGLAVSQYNEAELKEMGYRSTSVTPLLLDFSTFDHDVDRPTLDWLSRLRDRGGASILFVGRIAPNKAQHDLVKALIAYRTLYDPAARLHLVGGASSPAYFDALRRFVGHTGVRDSVDFAGSVSDAVRSSYFRGADVLLCLSDHEGFCVPLLEAMYNGLPIVAYASSAIPETLQGAGILLDSKEPVVVAAALHRVLSDEALRSRLVEAGRRRLADFSLDRTRRTFAEAISAVLAEGAG